MFPGACPADATKAIEVLQTIRAQTWPPLPGPILRPSGDGVFVDLEAATNRLYRMMALTPSGDTIANIQGRHFEDVIQNRIDASAWAPVPELRNIRGNNLRRLDGTFIADLDAVGEFGDTLLIVDCKSTPYAAEYDAGFYTAVRNIQSTLLGKLANWTRVIDELKVSPVGPNYNFSRFSRIAGIVCTPHVFYVPLGAATQTVVTSPGGVPLRTVSSYSEMDRFLTDWPDLSSG
jgi:hypothetical protein